MPNHQELIKIEVSESTTVQRAIHMSGILKKYDDINLTSQNVGIFGKVVKLDRILQENDRVEIYRPLQIDPMEARRLRAIQQK